MKKNKTTNLVIPDRRRTIKEKDISDREDLRTVEMPDSVSVISESAFFHCVNLERVRFSSRLKTIAPFAFADCYKLKNIDLPVGLESIGDAAFFKCFELEYVMVPYGVKTIGEDAFGMCQKLKHILISKATLVSENAFRESPQCEIEYYEDRWKKWNDSDDQKPTKYICDVGYGDEWYNFEWITDKKEEYVSSNFLDAVLYDENEYKPGAVYPVNSDDEGFELEEGNVPFYLLYTLGEDYKPVIEKGELIQLIKNGIDKNVLESETVAELVEKVIDDVLDAMPDEALPSNCAYEPKYIIKDGVGIIPQGTKVIEEHGFTGCKNLKSVVIPDSVIEIEDSAFSGCIRLKDIIIPNSIKKIGAFAFSGCTSLKSITIPESVEEIGWFAFSNCKNMKSIVVQEGNKVYDSRENCDAIIETETNILVQGCTYSIIPESVSAIGGGAFSGCTRLSGICIPNSVTRIGNAAFCDCTSLTNIILPKSLKVIEAAAFANSGLTEIVLPDSVKSVDEEAFDCEDLENIYVSPKKVKYFKRIMPEYYEDLVEPLPEDDE